MKIEVLGTERRRRWSLQDKLQIVEETLQPGVKVNEVARRHGLAPRVVFTSIGRRHCTRWSRPASSMRSTRAPDWLTSWHNCRNIQLNASTSSCPGTGKRRRTSRRQPDLRAF